MSTVGKITADKVIAGEFPEDTPVIAIVKYENVFNGGDSYKLCYTQAILDYCMEGAHYIRNPIIYWKATK